jgi:hypothetical protein
VAKYLVKVVKGSVDVMRTMDISPTLTRMITQSMDVAITFIIAKLEDVNQMKGCF